MTVLVLRALPANEYYGQDHHFGMSQLLDFEKNGPQFFMRNYVPYAPSPSESPAFRFGRAAHCYILEGEEAFADEWVVSEGPTNAKTDKPFGPDTKVYAEWKKSIGKPVLPPEEMDTIEAMRDHLLADSITGPILRDIKDSEVTLREERIGWWSQCRLDAVTTDHIVEFKTTSDLEGFERDFWRYQYDRKAAFYADMANRGGYQQAYTIIACEKSMTPRVRAFTVDPSVLIEGTYKNEQLFSAVTKCLNEDSWPLQYRTYPIKTITKPKWLEE